MEHDFEYYAFISYKRKDEKWAKWLQEKLEHYKLPALIRKENPSLPKYIRPVFRDKTDLDAGLLKNNIQKELEKSRYLIVICSPASAKAEWVGTEIHTFVTLGREDRIIPFIVAGTPNSADPAQECFHPVIKKSIPEEVLGINVQEIGKEQAFVKVAAKILGLRFDTLWNRNQREQRKKRIIAAGSGLALLIGLFFLLILAPILGAGVTLFGLFLSILASGAGAVLLTGLFFLRLYNRTRVEYYADYVDCWGLVEGVVKLSKAIVKKRNSHYRFERSRGKLRRVVHANSEGKPVDHTNSEHTDRATIQEFEYTDKRLTNTHLKNAQGKTTASYFWGGEKYNTVDIKSDEKGSSDAALGGSLTSISDNLFSGTGNSSKSEIRRYRLVRDNQGFIIRKEFKRYNGNDSINASDDGGIWGFEYTNDEFGRPIELRYLGHGDRGYFLMSDLRGVAGRKYEYDTGGYYAKVIYIDENKKPTVNEQLWAIEVNVSEVNIIEEKYFGADGEPCLHRDGYAIARTKYDDRGNRIEAAFFGVDGELSLITEGYAIWRAKYDDRGNEIERTYFGIDGEPCLHRDGNTIFRAKYDKRGNEIEQAYFGIDGKPCLVTNGCAGWRAKYDDRENCIEAVYFGIDGELSLITEGYAIWRAKYDDRGNEIERTYFGIDDKPCIMLLGCAKQTIRYDERNRQIEKAYFDKNDRLCVCTEGWAKWTVCYDEYGDEIERIYYDAVEKPIEVWENRGNIF